MIAILCYCFPPYITLIMAHIKSMYMATSVFTLNCILCLKTCKREYAGYEHYYLFKLHKCKDNILS